MSVSPEKKSVLITGGAGYIGSHAVLAFLDAGWSVVVADDLSVGARAAVPEGARFYQTDCASPEIAAIVRANGVTAAVHFAGVIDVEESIREPAKYYETNTAKAARFFTTATAAGVGAIVFSSTAAVYGDVRTSQVDEDEPTRPISPYGKSKLAAEWMLRDIGAASGGRHVILRYFNVAGADPSGRAGSRADASHVVKRACDAALGLLPGFVINGTDYDTPDGSCVRDFIHVSDLAAAHVCAVEHLLCGGESLLLNCGYGRGFSVRAVAEMTRRVAGRSFPVEIGPRRPGDAVSVVADARRLRAALGWRPRHDDLEDIIRTALAWERARAASANDATPQRLSVGM